MHAQERMLVLDKQEAITCWAHLTTTVLGDEATAPANGLADLVITVLKKVAGDGSGLAVISCGTSPSPRQAAQCDAPLPPALRLQVCSSLQMQADSGNLL